MKKVAIINSKAPFTDNSGKDALDLALILGSYEQDISLFFHDDGVWQLHNNQQPELIQQKDYLKTFSAFELYDIENIYVCAASLKERELTSDFHIETVSVLSRQEFNAMLAAHQTIFRF